MTFHVQKSSFSVLNEIKLESKPKCAQVKMLRSTFPNLFHHHYHGLKLKRQHDTLSFPCLLAQRLMLATTFVTHFLFFSIFFLLSVFFSQLIIECLYVCLVICTVHVSTSHRIYLNLYKNNNIRFGQEIKEVD